MRSPASTACSTATWISGKVVWWGGGVATLWKHAQFSPSSCRAMHVPLAQVLYRRIRIWQVFSKTPPVLSMLRPTPFVLNSQSELQAPSQQWPSVQDWARFSLQLKSLGATAALSLLAVHCCSLASDCEGLAKHQPPALYIPASQSCKGAVGKAECDHVVRLHQMCTNRRELQLKVAETNLNLRFPQYLNSWLGIQMSYQHALDS